ncbi:RNA polymerase sigma factor [bacterium]|nr:RNA polymerase sigma factor [bacterium]
MNFEEIIKTNKQNIKNIVRLITKQDNEDVEQEVYIKLWKNSESYQERGSMKSWVNTIAKNASKDYLKSAAVKNEQACSEDDSALVNIRDRKRNPEEQILVSERQKSIINAVENLKPKFKEVIMMCEIYGYSYEEASKKLNCPIGTIKSRIFNAKKELAIVLQDLL